MQILERNFQTRKELIEYVKIIAPCSMAKPHQSLLETMKQKIKCKKI